MMLRRGYNVGHDRQPYGGSRKNSDAARSQRGAAVAEPVRVGVRDVGCLPQMSVAKRACREEPVTPRVEPGSNVNDVLRHYPRTGSVFLQTGRLFVDQPKSLYAHYPEQTIAEYAERNGIDLEYLLRRLNAEAEASAWEASRTSSRSLPQR
jgi:hypothetical protein